MNVACFDKETYLSACFLVYISCTVDKFRFLAKKFSNVVLISCYISCEENCFILRQNPSSLVKVTFFKAKVVKLHVIFSSIAGTFWVMEYFESKYIAFVYRLGGQCRYWTTLLFKSMTRSVKLLTRKDAALVKNFHNKTYENRV